jgi:hypothetical protein
MPTGGELRGVYPSIVHIDEDSLRRLYVNDELPRNRSPRSSDAHPGRCFGGCADLVSLPGSPDRYPVAL